MDAVDTMDRVDTMDSSTPTPFESSEKNSNTTAPRTTDSLGRRGAGPAGRR